MTNNNMSSLSPPSSSSSPSLPLSPPSYSSLPLDDKIKLTNLSDFQRYPESVELLQQLQYPLSHCLQKAGIQSSMKSSVQSSTPMEPIFMPIMMPQATSYPYQQSVPDKPINVMINSNNRAEGNSFARDYRICNFCKRGIMTKKKDWLRIAAILFVSMLCPPFSFLCCFFLCTRMIYYGECSACHRISKKEHK